MRKRFPPPSPRAEVILDGVPIKLPQGRHSVAAVSVYLETLAMEQHRILCSFLVDGEAAVLSSNFPPASRRFSRIEATTMDLEDLPLQILTAARQQIDEARTQAEQAAVLVLINEGCVAREVWWKLARTLKEPLLTLSLLPDTICGSQNGSASLTQLRKWQLEQLATILRAVDEACWSDQSSMLSNALENRVLPWLHKLQELLTLWYQTALAGCRAGRISPTTPQSELGN